MGYAVLSEAEALEEVGERDEADPLWIAAIVLMVLGEIYALWPSAGLRCS